MIKAVTFDLDGVCFINGKSSFIVNLGRLGVPENEARRVFLKSEEMNEKYKIGQMTDQEYWSWAIKQWKIDLSVNEIVDLLIKGYKVNQEVVEAVRKTKKKGYKALICSNNFPARVNGLQERFRFLDNFDVAVFSYQVGATKPSEKIFRELVNRARVRPEEIVFADDNEDNLAGAKRIGIQAFYYEGFGQFLAKLKELGVNI